MGQFLEYVKIAYKSILSNKGRTFLTMLGIIIGISSVIMITGLGSGVKMLWTDRSEISSEARLTFIPQVKKISQWMTLIILKTMSKA